MTGLPSTAESLAELIRIASDTYLFRYLHHVAMFVTTDEGVILIDPIGQANARTPSVLKEVIASVSEQPVRFMVYSHWGADHGTGGVVFRDTAQFVGQQNVAGKIAAANDPTSPVPDITFDSTLSLKLGGKTIDLYHADIAPQDDYIFVHHPAERLVMAVDLVQPLNVPFRDLLGDPDRTAERLQWLHDSLDFDTVVSGHSLPQLTGTRADVAAARQYFLELSDAIASARGGGAADNSSEMVAAVQATLSPRYGSWRRFDAFLALNIQGMLRWRATA